MKNYTARHVYDNGDIFYYDERWRLHRTDGPAVERANGDRCWCIHGKYHRFDGPAYNSSNGMKEYWINDKPIWKPRFEKLQEFRKLFNDDEFLNFLLLEGRIVL